MLRSSAVSNSSVSIPFVGLGYMRKSGISDISTSVFGSITVKTADGAFEATCVVTVTDPKTNVEISDTPLFRIYPNPTGGMLTLEFDTAGERYITLVDITGRVLMRQTLSVSTARIDINNYPAGVYLLTIDEGKQQKTVRVRLEK